jgi:hypothetical protein
VVATAPIPTVRTPSFPFASAIGITFFATFLSSPSKAENHCFHANGLCFASLRKIALDFESELIF